LSGGLPDIRKETESFLSGYDCLVRLPLISDAEVESLFSADVIRTLEQLRQYDAVEGVCASCINRCCKLINCELYDPAFGVCPAFSLRPLLCRMHYCHKFELAYEKEVRIIGDIFLESLLAAQHQGKRRTILFDSPPLAPASPKLAWKIVSLMTAFREGRMEKAEVLEAIQVETKNYRMTV
jgi:hypothetical protein